MALKLKIKPGVVQTSNLLISLQTTLNGLLDFDGSVGINRDNATPDINGNRTIKWNMWLDSSVAKTENFSLLTISDGPAGQSQDYDGFWLSNNGFNTDNTWRLISDPCINTASQNNITVTVPTDIYGKQLRCEVKKQTKKVLYFKINDVSLNQTIAPAGTAIDIIRSGASDESGYEFQNCTLWDIKVINDDTSQLVHYWKGYPVGNTEAAWEDQVGTQDLSIYVRSGFTANLRNVTASDSENPGSVLLIAPPSVPIPVPGAPTLDHPLDTSILGTVDPSLAWFSVSGADTYWVQLDNDPGFGSLLYDVSALAVLYYDVSALDTSTAYYWRAAATNTSGTGSWSSEWEFYTPQAESSAMLYIATNALASPFDPVFTTSAGTLEWDMADGSIINANSFSHTYTAGGTKIIKVEPGTASGPEAITEINMVSDNLVGLLDLTPLINLGGAFEINGNSSLTTILMPNSSQVFTKFIGWFTSGITYVDASGLTGLGGELNFFACSNLQTILLPTSSEIFSQIQLASCDLTGTLDFSGLTGWTPELYADINPNLTSIIFPESSIVMTDMQISQNDLTGVLDLSGLTGFGGAVQFSYNSNLTGILLPDSSQAFTTFEAYWCDLTGTLDMTPLSGFGDPAGGVIDVNTNPNLTQLLLPSSSRIVQSVYAYDCSLAGTLDVSGLTNWYSILDVERNSNLLEILLPSAPTDAIEIINARDCSLSLTSVDNIFSYCDTWFSSNTPVAALTLSTDGGGSAAPTDGSSNTNIQSLVSIFSGAGQTFTYNINYP